MTPTTRNRIIGCGLAVPIWAGTMLIHLYDSKQRGEVIPIYVYNYYGWIVATWREPGRVITEAAAFFAILLGAILSLMHIVSCFIMGRLVWYLIMQSKRGFQRLRSSGSLS